MQHAVTSMIDAARSRFATKAPAGPMALAAEPVQPQRRPTAPATLEILLSPNMVSNLVFTSSPLAAAPGMDQRLVDEIHVAFRDRNVQNLAGVVTAKASKLHCLAGYRSAISAAVKAVQADHAEGGPVKIRPKAVAEKLRAVIEHLEEQIISAREDKAAHEAVAKVARDRHQPLVAAVRQRVEALHAEGRGLSDRKDAARRAGTMRGSATQRHEALLALGLKPEQIASLNSHEVPDPEPQIAAMKARIEQIDTNLLPPLSAFLADPMHDEAPLAGLGFDELIAARNRTYEVGE